MKQWILRRTQKIALVLVWVSILYGHGWSQAQGNTNAQPSSSTGTQSEAAAAAANSIANPPAYVPPCVTTPSDGKSAGLQLAATTLDFGPHDLGTTTDWCAVTVTNKGNEPINSLRFKPVSGYGISSGCGETLAPRATCTISVNFSPPATGPIEGSLSASYRKGEATAPDSSVSLKGTGFVPRLGDSPGRLDFGTQLVNTTSVVKTLTLKAGTISVKAPQLEVTGDFTISPTQCNGLEPAISCAIAVTFTPKQVGESRGTITIKTDGPPLTVPLLGEGTAQCGARKSVFSVDGMKSIWGSIVVMGMYALALILVRWNMIAVPTRRLLMAQIDSVRARAAILNQTNPVIRVVTTLLDEAALTLEPSMRTLFDVLFWTRGQESAGWNRVHEAEERLVHLQDVETLRAGLQSAAADLKALNKPAATALAEAIDESLKGTATDWRFPILRDVLDFLAPQSEALAKEIDQALAPGTITDATAKALAQRDAAAKALAQRVLNLLSPAAALLGQKIQRVLDTNPAPATSALTELLQQAATTLNPEAAAISKQIKSKLDAASPLTAADWKPQLQQASDFLKHQSPLIAKIRVSLVDDPLPRMRALLSEALGILYDRTDTDFSTLASWHNKTTWLVGCGLLLIIALSVVLQHGVLFLVGATGGLLSRMSRSLKREDVPTDYGASWTTLFLSPVVGALAGWSGVLLIVLGVELNVLGSALKIDWCNPYGPVALALAFLLGFSERAFDQVLSQLENKLTPSTSSTPSAAEIKITTSSALPAAKINQAYEQKLEAVGATTLKWTLIAGTLPPGLSLDPSGRVTGTPKGSPDMVKFTLQVADASGKTKSQEFTITVTN
jgi:hypothetical protein